MPKRRRLTTHSTRAKVGRSRLEVRLEVENDGKVHTRTSTRVMTRSAVRRTARATTTVCEEQKTIPPATSHDKTSNMTHGPASRTRSSKRTTISRVGLKSGINTCTARQVSAARKKGTSRYRPTRVTRSTAHKTAPKLQGSGSETDGVTETKGKFRSLADNVSKRVNTQPICESGMAPPKQAPKLSEKTDVHNNNLMNRSMQSKSSAVIEMEQDILRNVSEVLRELGCGVDLEGVLRKRKLQEKLNKSSTDGLPHRQLRRSASIEEGERENLLLGLMKRNGKTIPTTAGIAEMYESLLPTKTTTVKKNPSRKVEACKEQVEKDENKQYTQVIKPEGAGGGDRFQINDDLRRVEETRGWIRTRVSRKSRESAAHLNGDHVQIHQRKIEKIVGEQFELYCSSTVFGSVPKDTFVAILRQVIISDCIERNSAAEVERRNRAKRREQGKKNKSEKFRLDVDESNLIGVSVLDHHEIQDVGQGILHQMRRKEQHHRPNRNLLRFHDEITNRMRAILFDWMIEVGQEFFLRRSALHSAFYFVDRYLSKVRQVPKVKLQLVGAAALWLATKTEDQTTFRVVSLAEATAGAYRPCEIITMEREMIEVFEWKLNPVTMYTWAEWYVQALGHKQTNDQTKTTVTHFGENNPISENTPQRQFGSQQHSSLQNRANAEYGGLKLSSTWAQGRKYNGELRQVSNELFTVIDSVSLDVNTLYFLPSMVAATALYLVTEDEELVEEVTLYSVAELTHCARCISWAMHVPSIPLQMRTEMMLAKFQIPKEEFPMFQVHNPHFLNAYRSFHQKDDPPKPCCLDFAAQSRADWSESTMATMLGSTIDRTTYLSPVPLRHALTTVSPDATQMQHKKRIQPAIPSALASEHTWLPGSGAISTTTTQFSGEFSDAFDETNLETTEELD